MDKWYVYILEMDNWKYYVWSTKDVNRRFDEHCRWLTKSTKNNRPLKLLYCREFEDYRDAIKMEYYLKKQKSRKIIEKFMNEIGD